MTAPTYVGYSVATANSVVETTTIDLPAGTQEGDLLILGLIGGWFPGLGECNDARMTAINTENMGTRTAGIYTGLATTSTAPLSIHLLGVSDIVGQFAIAVCFAFRHTRRDTFRTLANSSIDGEFGDGLIPALAGEGAGSFCLLMQSAGFGGSDPPGWDRTGGLYTAVETQSNTYVRVSLAYSVITPTPTSTNPNTDLDDRWRATVFGYITSLIAPPCRLTARADGLGAGAKRIWPPPRSHQGSPRRGGSTFY